MNVAVTRHNIETQAQNLDFDQGAKESYFRGPTLELPIPVFAQNSPSQPRLFHLHWQIRESDQEDPNPKQPEVRGRPQLPVFSKTLTKTDSGTGWEALCNRTWNLLHKTPLRLSLQFNGQNQEVPTGNSKALERDFFDEDILKQLLDRLRVSKL